ncbi:MAG: hypothetical protein OXI54_16005 [Chloroflexota bacterium]|nr:hypothetical protein [Chloroflexota bacterium]MDE2685632.1 hypothetical protein [Chloroflexota bacterium]
MSDKVKDDVHWVDKGEAARELEVSLSTLDRMIRKGEVEVGREGRRVYVKLPGPRYPSDRELLRQSRARVERLERTVGELAEEADRLEQERDQARAETDTAIDEYRKLEEVLLREQNGHQRARRWTARLGIAVAVLVVLLAVTVLVAWWLIT